MSETRCTALSLHHEEPLAATAVEHTWRWIGVEYRGPWSRKGFPDCALPDAAMACLTELAAQPGVRIQFIRRHGRSRGPFGLLFGDTREGRVHAFDLPNLDALAELDWGGLLAGTAHAAERLDEPVYLVCTHGVRDRCCAVEGIAMYRALHDLAPQRVWQTTHLGGHRFAPTLVTLPEGICYGRVQPGEAASLVAEHDAGRLFRLDAVRGRVALSRPAQAAEHCLRLATGERRIDAFHLHEEHAPSPKSRELDVEVAGCRERIALRRVRLPQAFAASCGGEAKPQTTWIAQG